MKNYMLLLFCLFIAFPSFSQVDIGLRYGGAFYFGDISASNSRSVENARETIGLYGRYNVNKNFSVQLAYNWAQIIGTDAYDANATKYRNLSVNTFINEVSLMPEFNFLNFKIGEEAKVSAYVGAGLSFFHFMPTVYYQSSSYIRLQEIGTEGQGLPGYDAPYKQYSMAIPMSGGIKFAFNDLISIDWSILNNRYTFTDYLDDVSKVYPDLAALQASGGIRAVYLSTKGTERKEGDARGNSKTNDWYGTSTLGISFNIGAVNMKKKKKQEETVKDEKEEAM